MPTILLIISIIINALLITIIVVNYKRNQQTFFQLINLNEDLFADYQEMSSTYTDEMKKLSSGTNLLAQQMAELQNLNDVLAQENNLYKEKETTLGDFEMRQQTLLNSIASAENQLEENKILLESRQAALQNLDSMYSEQVERLNGAHEEEKLLMNLIEGFHAQQRQMEAELSRLRHESIDLQSLLVELKETHRLAVKKVLGDESLGFGQGWTFNLKPNELRLIDLLNELVALYPELASDLNGLKWKKVWLPRLQELCVREGLDKVSGIYRIGVRAQGNKDHVLNYIGQAVNIKDRWYQHVKKMLGMDNRGGEKLYDAVEGGHVEWCEWEVLEKMEDESGSQHRDAWLDERERYWIEFYGSKEWGLNKK